MESSPREEGPIANNVAIKRMQDWYVVRSSKAPHSELSAGAVKDGTYAPYLET
jgi:hypothetical protein